MMTQSVEQAGASSGPRIYNLFPLLAGPVAAWSDHLDRIAGMGFDWVWLNPFHYPGFSGSLYAVKDPYRLHPLLAGDGADPKKLLKGFTKAAGSRDLAVMMDLVINHTAKDSVLASEHPDWFLRDPGGELRSPRAIDPVDPRKFTVWGDLAEIDYHNAGCASGADRLLGQAGPAPPRSRLQRLSLRCRLSGAGGGLAGHHRRCQGARRRAAGSSPRPSAARPSRCWG